MNKIILIHILEKISGKNLGNLIIQESYLCPIIPKHPQILFCLTKRYDIIGWREAVSLFLEQNK